MNDKEKCFYCNNTGYIEGKKIVPDNKLPDQMCPYCEIGQATYRGYRKAMKIQLDNYKKLITIKERAMEVVCTGNQGAEDKVIGLIEDFDKEAGEL